MKPNGAKIRLSLSARKCDFAALYPAQTAKPHCLIWVFGIRIFPKCSDTRNPDQTCSKVLASNITISTCLKIVALRKHAYTTILNILPPKIEKFQIKILIFFIFLHKT